MAGESKRRRGTHVTSLVHDSRPRIELPGDNRLVSDFATDLGKAVRGADIFSRGGLVYTLNESGDALRPMSAEAFQTWAEQFVIGYRVRASGVGSETVQLKRTMGASVASAVLASPQFLRELRPIERFNPIRLPIIERNGHGRLKILPEGYDEDSATFTREGAPGYADKLPLETAKAVIEELLGEFGFADEGRSKSVAIAGMLTVFGSQLLPKGSIRPCFINLANAEGAGKTLLVKCATVPVLGGTPASTYPDDEDEMRKLILSAVLELRPVLVLDNVKGRLASESLEGFLTSQQWSGRVLGGNRTFTGDNLVTVFVTGNGCTVSPDMRRRSLFCELFLKEERAEDRVFKQPLETSVLLDRREEILTALMGLVRNWAHAGMPSPSRSHSSFAEWAATIGGIVEAAGYPSPLETPTIEGAADVDGDDMRVLVKALTENGPLNSVTFDELIEMARDRGIFESAIEQLDDHAKAAKSALGAMFRRYDDRMIGGCRFSLVGKGHKRRYQAERINPS